MGKLSSGLGRDTDVQGRKQDVAESALMYTPRFSGRTKETEGQRGGEESGDGDDAKAEDGSFL